MNTREILEQALATDFDDLVTHRAYADLLAEEDDPRSELIRVQFALENQDLPIEDQYPLKVREWELLTEHGDRWLGSLTAHLYRPNSQGHPCQVRLERGWVRSVSVVELDPALATAICACPLGRFLRWLSVRSLSGPDAGWVLHAGLVGAPFLWSLETLELGMAVAPLLWSEEEMGALFRLPMPNLRRLSVAGSVAFDLQALADNPTLAKLEDLSLEPLKPLEAGQPTPLTLAGLRAICRSPHLRSLTRLRLRRTDFGDDGVRELAESGILQRLTTLDLRDGAITDEGARLLIAQPGFGGMEVDVWNNALTGRVVALLEAANESANAGEQHVPGTTDYLQEFDME